MRIMWTWSCYEFFPVWSPEKSENVVCIWMNVESKRRWSSYFKLFMQLCMCYAVFLSVAGHFSKLFGHCDKSNVLCHSIALSDFHTDQWKRRTLNQWSLGLQHLGDTFSPFFCFPWRKKKACRCYFWDPSVFCPACPRSCRDTWCCCWTPDGRETLLGCCLAVTSYSHLIE